MAMILKESKDFDWTLFNSDRKSMLGKFKGYRSGDILRELPESAGGDRVRASGEGIGDIPPAAATAVDDNGNIYGVHYHLEKFKVKPTEHPFMGDAGEKYFPSALGLDVAGGSDCTITARTLTAAEVRARDAEMRAQMMQAVRDVINDPKYQAALEEVGRRNAAAIASDPFFRRVKHDPDALHGPIIPPLKQAPIRKNVQRRDHSLAAEALGRATNQTRLSVEGGSHRNLVGAIRECKAEML